MEIPAPAILVGEHVAVAGGNSGSGGRDRYRESRRRVHVAGLTPIKARMRHNDFESTDKEGQERKRGEPVGNANEKRVPQTKRFGH